MLSFGARIGVFYALIFLVYGTYLPFFPAWLSSLGIGSAAIGLLIGVPVILRVPLSLLVSVLADAIGDRRLPIKVLAAVLAISSLVLLLFPAFWPVAVAGSLLAVAKGVILPLIDALAMSGKRDGRHNYGVIRLWGSVTFVVANFACGALMAKYGAVVVPWWILVTSVGVAIWSFLLPRGEIQDDDAGVQQPKARWLAGLPLFQSRIFLAFVLAVGAVHASHSLLYSFGTIHWQALGYDGTMVGLFWGIGVIGEVILFAYARPVFARISPGMLLLVGAGASVLRMGGLAFDPPLALLIVLQLGHALSFGATHLAMMHFINEAVPDRLTATAQGMFTSISGIIGGVAFLASGPLYDGFAGSAYLFSAGMALVGVIAGLYVWLRWDGRKIDLCPRG